MSRLPSFLRPVWNPDEGFVATQAKMLAAGGRLYVDVVDRKPPLLPWLYEGCFALFGADSLWPLRVLAALAQLATALLLASLARRRWGDTAGRRAGVLYVLVSIGLNPEDAQGAGFEVFMLPWTVAAMWCADRGRWAMAGLAVAVAALSKQTGAVMLLPVAYLLWRTAAPRAPAAYALALGGAAPLAVAAFATDPAGFVFWTLTGSGAYASPEGSALLALGRAGLNTGVLAASCAGLLLPLALRWRSSSPTLSPCPDLWLWLASSAAAVTAGFHFFGHYFLQLMPPLTLLGVYALRELPRRWERTALALAAASCAIFLSWGLLAPAPGLDHARKLAAAAARLTSPGERILVWGMQPETYWLAARPPASRYLTAGLLTNFSGGRDSDRVGEQYAVPGAWKVLRAELAAHPPALIVDDSCGRLYAPSHLPSLQRLLSAGYRHTATTDCARFYTRRTDRGPTVTAP